MIIRRSIPFLFLSFIIKLIFYFQILIIHLQLHVVNGQTLYTTTDTCTTSNLLHNINLNLIFPPAAALNTTSLTCNTVWTPQNFILWHKESSPGLWTFLLSAPNANSWIGVGFSKTGKMLGASAVIGWPTRSGAGKIKQYYLSGFDKKAVLPDQGNLTLVDMTFFATNTTIYLAFQLKAESPIPNIICAIGPKNKLPSTDNFVEEHTSANTIKLDFSTGESGSGSGDSDESDPSAQLTLTHGLLNLLGWGIVLPLGMMAARYLKHFDPVWFYTHLAFQIVGFGLAVAGIVTGLRLESQFGFEVDTHKRIGITALTLACFQVTALLVRPNKESKMRMYWNWFHHWFGRIGVVLGISNSFLGISIAEPGNSWNIGLGVSVGCLLIIAIVNELRILRSSNKK